MPSERAYYSTMPGAAGEEYMGGLAPTPIVYGGMPLHPRGARIAGEAQDKSRGGYGRALSMQGPPITDEQRQQWNQKALSELIGATSIYESLAAPEVETERVRGAETGGMPGQVFQSGMETWRYGSPGDKRRMAARAFRQRQEGGMRRKVPGEDTATPEGVTQRQQFQIPAIPDLPVYQAPEYKPPAYSETKETALRQEYMGPGLRQSRQAMQEAIIGSQSLDNPNARIQFARAAMEGYGRGLEDISSGAGREARARAESDHARAMQAYQVGYQAKTQEAMMNYQAQLDATWKEWEAQWQQNMMDYNTGGGGRTRNRRVRTTPNLAAGA